MRALEKSIIILLMTLSVLPTTAQRNERLIDFGQKWNAWNDAGDFDSLVIHTMPFLNESIKKGDSVSAFYAGIFIAQAFVSMQEIDSVEKYIDISDRYFDGCDFDNAKCVYYNVKGQLALRSRLDYEDATKMFLLSLEYANKHESAINYIALTYDIVHIFYLLGDNNGMEYAKRAYEVAQTLDQDTSPYCISLIMMSMMHFISGDIHNAVIFCDRAVKIADKMNFESLKPDLNMLRGDIAAYRNDSLSAIRFYSTVAGFPENIYPGKKTLAYLKIGDIYHSAGNDNKAIEAYNSGLEISQKWKIPAFRKELLESLYRLYYGNGQMQEAFLYYERFRSLSDSLANISNEKKFYTLMMSYQNLKHENEISVANLTLSKTRLRMYLIVATCLFLIIICITLYLLYREQKKKYLLIIDKYQSFAESFDKKEIHEPAEGKEDIEDNADRELYVRIQELMQDKHVYRQKNITRESLADMLGTNRTYLSRAINAYSGQTVNDYINTYRINEAVKLLSENGKDVNAKQLAEDLGYASVNVFYQVFKRKTGCSFSIYKKNIGLVHTKYISQH